MQQLSSLYLISLLKVFQGREADFCGHTARMHATFTQPRGSLAWDVTLLWHDPQQRKKKPKQKCSMEASKAQEVIL